MDMTNTTATPTDQLFYTWDKLNRRYTVHADRFGHGPIITTLHPVRVEGTPNDYFIEANATTAYATPAKAIYRTLGAVGVQADEIAPTYKVQQVGTKCTIFIPGVTDEPLHNCRRTSTVDGMATIEQVQGSEWVEVLTVPADTRCYIDAKASCIPELMD